MFYRARRRRSPEAAVEVTTVSRIHFDVESDHFTKTGSGQKHYRERALKKRCGVSVGAVGALVRKTASFVEFSLCLSRACLGKMFVLFINGLKMSFFAGRGGCGEGSVEGELGAARGHG